MDNDARSYQLPTEILPSLELSHHAEDLVAFRDFLRGRGIGTRNTRIERYIDYLQQAAGQAPADAAKVFKNSVRGPFVSSIDWLLYVLREVHELMWILRGLKVHLPLGADEKLKIIVGGTDFAVLDIDSQSRDVQFELRIASYFCQARCEVDLSTDTDVVALTKDQAFYLECKRVGSRTQLVKRLSEARRQLNRKMPRNRGRRIVFGCVAADVTRAAFSHNGLTFGMTNEHSRDIIQKKLVDVARASQKTPLFRASRSLFCYWLQIHIPSLVLHPVLPVTRFSSYHILRERLARQERKAARAFYDMFESVSRHGDKREMPATKLALRTSVEVPPGTTFSLDEDLLQPLLRGDEIEKRPDEIVGTLSMNGRKHEFSFLEFSMLAQKLIKDRRKVLIEDPARARLQLLLEMYLQRFPYEESEPDNLKDQVRGDAV